MRDSQQIDKTNYPSKMLPVIATITKALELIEKLNNPSQERNTIAYADIVKEFLIIDSRFLLPQNNLSDEKVIEYANKAIRIYLEDGSRESLAKAKKLHESLTNESPIYAAHIKECIKTVKNLRLVSKAFKAALEKDNPNENYKLFPNLPLDVMKEILKKAFLDSPIKEFAFRYANGIFRVAGKTGEAIGQAVTGALEKNVEEYDKKHKKNPFGKHRQLQEGSSPMESLTEPEKKAFEGLKTQLLEQANADYKCSPERFERTLKREDFADLLTNGIKDTININSQLFKSGVQVKVAEKIPSTIVSNVVTQPVERKKGQGI